MTEIDETADVRRDFAAGWGRMGATWGVSPSSATVQGYFLVHGGPLTETELRAALGMSHRAAFAAIAECEAWGLIEAAAPQRSGRRGPASRAWVVVGDPWEWFRRVATSRIDRETGPVLPLVEASLARARGDGGRRARRSDSRRWAPSQVPSTGAPRRWSRPMPARSDTSWASWRGWTRRPSRDSSRRSPRCRARTWPPPPGRLPGCGPGSSAGSFGSRRSRGSRGCSSGSASEESPVRGTEMPAWSAPSSRARGDRRSWSRD